MAWYDGALTPIDPRQLPTRKHGWPATPRSSVRGWIVANGNTADKIDADYTTLVAYTQRLLSSVGVPRFLITDTGILRFPYNEVNRAIADREPALAHIAD